METEKRRESTEPLSINDNNVPMDPNPLSPGNSKRFIMCTYQDIHSKGHHDHCDQQIRDRQGDNKVVGHCVQRPFPHHRHYDQHVAEEGQEGKENQRQCPVVVLDWNEDKKMARTEKGR